MPGDLTALLAPAWRHFATAGDASRLIRTLRAHSRLPGPRGNLELVAAFASLVADPAAGPVRARWDLCAALADTDAAQAPENTPGVFVVVCGAVGLGALGAASAARVAQALRRLRALAGDPRWRVREGVAMGLQRLLAARPSATLTALRDWVRGEDWLAMRAVAAAVAEPPLLRDPAVARAAVTLHRRIVARVLAARARTSDGFRALRQTLGYSISVVAVARPREGLALLRALDASGDADGGWIVRENLKKARLKAVRSGGGWTPRS
jgi:hypothetical protein